ncbi:hypothetical protein FQN54_002000 [Arachnomyces sp. PD_36]|nr:hypothetical protein FQN54_002000 [Arachnomyces sp. PD_36]
MLDPRDSNSQDEDGGVGFFEYDPSHILPAVFAALVGLSMVFHVYQNFRYRFWRVTFFMVYGGIVYFAGWILRTIATYHPSNLNIFIAQTVLTYAGPPIYSAAAYNLVGRLMHYLPMFATLNPNRVVYFFVYLGALVEALTGAGAGRLATAGDDKDRYRSGGTLISVSLVLQAVVETLLIAMVATLHYRCSKANMLTRNVKIVCFTLYGTSTFVILRCVFRAIESFTTYFSDNCEGICATISHNEWYIYALEVAPMVIFTYWLNILHPGRQLPSNRSRYLDYNKVERIGPGWTDKRSALMTFIDPLDFIGIMNGEASHEKYWLNPEAWPICDDSFAEGTASNVPGKSQPSKV